MVIQAIFIVNQVDKDIISFSIRIMLFIYVSIEQSVFSQFLNIDVQLLLQFADYIFAENGIPGIFLN